MYIKAWLIYFRKKKFQLTLPKKRLRDLPKIISGILTMELALRQNCNLFWVSNHIFLQVYREWLFQPLCGNCFLNFWPKDTDQVHIHLLEFSGTLKWNTDKNKSRINNSTIYHIISQIQNIIIKQNHCFDKSKQTNN